MAEREWMTIREAAERLNVSTGRLYQLVRAGLVPICRLPGSRAIRIPTAAWSKWMSEQTERALSSVKYGDEDEA